MSPSSALSGGGSAGPGAPLSAPLHVRRDAVRAPHKAAPHYLVDAPLLSPFALNLFAEGAVLHVRLGDEDFLLRDDTPSPQDNINNCPHCGGLSERYRTCRKCHLRTCCTQRCGGQSMAAADAFLCYACGGGSHPVGAICRACYQIRLGSFYRCMSGKANICFSCYVTEHETGQRAQSKPVYR